MAVLRVRKRDPHARGSGGVSVRQVEPAEALADLTAISSQIEAAVIFDSSGGVLAATLADDERARRVGRAAQDLVAAASQARPGLGSDALTQLEASTREGSVFVVRDGERLIAATTAPRPTAGLVFFDLKTCLRNISASEAGSATPDASPPA